MNFCLPLKQYLIKILFVFQVLQVPFVVKKKQKEEDISSDDLSLSFASNIENAYAFLSPLSLSENENYGSSPKPVSSPSQPNKITSNLDNNKINEFNFCLFSQRNVDVNVNIMVQKVVDFMEICFGCV